MDSAPKNDSHWLENGFSMSDQPMMPNDRLRIYSYFNYS